MRKSPRLRKGPQLENVYKTNRSLIAGVHTLALACLRIQTEDMERVLTKGIREKVTPRTSSIQFRVQNQWGLLTAKNYVQTMGEQKEVLG